MPLSSNSMSTAIKPNVIVVVLLSSLLLGCTHDQSKPSDVVVVKRPPVRKIALVTVLEPSLLVENHGGVLGLFALPGYIAEKNIETNRGGDLKTGLRSRSLRFGAETTAALKEELQREGYEVTQISEVKRQPDDPTEIDFSSIKTDAQAILTAHYSDAGLFSGYLSTHFVPRLCLDVELLTPDGENELYSQDIEYGAYAKKRTEDEIPSDPKYAYGTFAEAMKNQPQVLESFRIGIHEIAALVAKQIRAAHL